jgi:hypothetical protein
MKRIMSAWMATLFVAFVPLATGCAELPPRPARGASAVAGPVRDTARRTKTVLAGKLWADSGTKDRDVATGHGE